MQTQEHEPRGLVARCLLRKLRDLDLTARIKVSSGFDVSVCGCASRGAPIEHGVRYAVRPGEGDPETLSIEWTGRELLIHVHGPGRDRRLRSELALDDEGRTTAGALAARLHVERADGRDVERFLRRVVRYAYAA